MISADRCGTGERLRFGSADYEISDQLIVVVQERDCRFGSADCCGTGERPEIGISSCHKKTLGLMVALSSR